MEKISNIVRNAKKVGVAIPEVIKNMKSLYGYHQKLEARRNEHAPIVHYAFHKMKHRTIWHPAIAWVDPEPPISRKEYHEYLWFLRDVKKLAPAVAPLFVGPSGILVWAAMLSKDAWLPSGFSESSDVFEKKYKWYVEYGDEIRQKIGPMLQFKITRLIRNDLGVEHVYFPDSLVESFKDTFLSHYTGAQRDVRKVLDITQINYGAPTELLMTNKDPVELTPELRKRLDEIRCSTVSKKEKEEQVNKAIREAYIQQELRGGPSTNKIAWLETPKLPFLFGDLPKERGTLYEELEFEVPIEEMKPTGDYVFVPNEDRTGTGAFAYETNFQVNEFLLLPWRFGFQSWRERSIVTWYEQMLQDDKYIELGGGVGKLTDLELKVALFDRAVMRADEDLTRGDMEARYKEISWLMSKRLSIAHILAWQTGFYRTTYSPEDDLPEPSILPKYNRTPLDVDTFNPRVPDEAGNPSPWIHPALYPNSTSRLHAELSLQS